MTPEEKLKNVIFRIIDANSLTGASLEETRQIFEAIQQAKSEWCKEQREKCAKEIVDEKNEILQDLVNTVRYLILNTPEP